jgi:cytochrome oxidase Cu insertion factor (SCO1/SenC/PrrC family)
VVVAVAVVMVAVVVAVAVVMVAVVVGLPFPAPHPPVQVDKLTARAGSLGKVQPLFITVDPKRDGVPEVAEYVKEFHPRLIGLTGTDEMIKHVCKGFRVYYSSGGHCPSHPMVPPGPADEDDDYIVDHTIILYLLDPEGGFVDYYGQTKTDEMVTSSVLMHMGKWRAEERGRQSLLARVTG